MRKSVGTSNRRLNRYQGHRHHKRSLLPPRVLYALCLILGGCGDSQSPPPPTIAELCEASTPTTKIINGQTCTPFSSAIGRLDLFDEEDNRIRCTAVLISPTRILTAAHCFEEFIVRATLTVGSEAREIIGVTPHPDIQTVGLLTQNDVALAELASPVPPPPTPVRIGLPASAGTTLYIFGYGRTTPGEDRTISETSLFAGTTTISRVDTMFIESDYTGDGANTCRGDSGGPAFVFDPSIGDLALVGLLSSGTKESCDIGDTSIFSNLTAPSIRSFLAQEAPEIEQLE